MDSSERIGVLRAQVRLELVHQVEELATRIQRDEAALSDRVTAVVRPMLKRLRDELAERAPSGAADPEVRTLSRNSSALLDSEEEHYCTHCSL